MLRRPHAPSEFVLVNAATLSSPHRVQHPNNPLANLNSMTKRVSACSPSNAGLHAGQKTFSSTMGGSRTAKPPPTESSPPSLLTNEAEVSAPVSKVIAKPSGKRDK